MEPLCLCCVYVHRYKDCMPVPVPCAIVRSIGMGWQTGVINIALGLVPKLMLAACAYTICSYMHACMQISSSIWEYVGILLVRKLGNVIIPASSKPSALNL